MTRSPGRAAHDEHQRKHGHLPTSDFLHKLAEEGRRSEFGRELAEWFRKVNAPEELIGRHTKPQA